MNHDATLTVKNKIPLGQKVAFGVGMFANQMFPAILGIFMVVLVQDLGFPGWMWGLIFFAPRIFDSITDPIMGFISDNTRSKWGRRRQYVFAGGIIMGVAFVIMWQLYKENTLEYNFWYFFLWSLVFYLGLTIFSVPYVAMGYEMTDDFHERTNIMAIAQWIGQWAWVIAPWFWIIMYNTELFPSAEVATRQLAIWVGIGCAICAIAPAIFIKSESTLDKEGYATLNMSTIGSSLSQIFKGFVEAFKIKPFRKLCIATFLIFNAFNTVAALTFFVIVYKLFNGDAGSAGYWVVLFGSISALGTTFLVIPAVAKMATIYGKKKAFLISQSISIIGYIMLWFLFIPGKPWMYIFALPFFSFGIGSLFTVMMSMTADVLDIDELNSGLRREGIFGAIYWWMVKVGFAIAGGLSGLIIAFVGFDAALPTIEQQDAVDGLHAFFCFFPAVGTMIAMAVMWSYDLTEEKSNEIRAELNRRKNPVRKPTSYYGQNKLAAFLSAEAKFITAPKTDFKAAHGITIKDAFIRNLSNGIHGISFSPYTEGQDIGHQLSYGQIERRMSVISPYTKWVRSFSCTEGNEYIPQAARVTGLKTMVGAWISDDKLQNEKEIQGLIKLAKDGFVDIAVVGNEVLLRGELSLQEILSFIQRVKIALPDIPVGYVDTYFTYHQHGQLADACDVILANCYPFWEGIHIDKASGYFEQMVNVARQAAKGKKVIITETGWPDRGDAIIDAQPSPDNAMKYFVNVNSFVQSENLDLFYFSSFDESWKLHHEGDVGQRWGLWDKNEKLKYQ